MESNLLTAIGYWLRDDNGYPEDLLGDILEIIEDEMDARGQERSGGKTPDETRLRDQCYTVRERLGQC